MTIQGSGITSPLAFATRVVSAKRAVSLAVLTLLLPALPGCQSITGNPNISEVRIIDASPDEGPIDVYQSTNILASDLFLGTSTTYIQITPGTYGILVDNYGTRQTIIQEQGTFQSSSKYTVLVGNYANSLQETILKDQSVAAPTGQIAVRFIDQSTRAGALDLYLVPTGSTLITVKPVLTNITFNVNTGYFNVPAGTYTLIALPAGTIPTVTGTTSYTGASITYSGGAARTFFLLDQQLITTPGIQVITGQDYDSPGATS
jgi:hypothetical protein